MGEWFSLYFIHLHFWSAPTLGSNTLTSLDKDAFIDRISLMHDKLSMMISIGLLSPHPPPCVAAYI